MDMLFAAFEKFPYWSFKGLVEYCKQPHSYLKEVLSEICIFIKKGPYTARYQLKPEFAGAGKGSQGSSGSSKAVNAELETTFNPAAVGVAKGESVAQVESEPQEALEEEEEDFEEDDDMVEVEV